MRVFELGIVRSEYRRILTAGNHRRGETMIGILPAELHPMCGGGIVIKIRFQVVVSDTTL